MLIRARHAALFMLVVATSAPGMGMASSTSRPGVTDGAPSTSPDPYTIPVEYFTLDNGLRVVLSRDSAAGGVVVVVDYNIGGRLEPRGRTGFAHLFEHMMFQGSRNLGKLEFADLAQSNGGMVNGTTGFDFTSFFDVVPSNTLEMILWAEADRMKGLDITEDNLKNQQAVVTNELKAVFLNRPYGGFPSVIMPQYVFSNWNNAHLAIGDPADLAAATVGDVQHFFDQYYRPNNAVLVVSGNFNTTEAVRWVRKYFASVPRGDVPAKPSLAEPRQDHEKHATKVDSLAPRPALAFAYRMPERNTPEFWAMGVIDQILAQGRDSRLYQSLVQDHGFTDDVTSNIPFDQMFSMDGPMLYIVSLFHDRDKPNADIMAAVDTVIDGLATTPVDQATLDRALVKIRSDFYSTLEEGNGFGRAHLLAMFALFDNDPDLINRIGDQYRRVTPALIQHTVREYLRPTNRTVLAIEPTKGQP